MTLRLYAHPFSSYSQKVLIALYENRTPFEYCKLGREEPAQADFERLWPLKRMPVLADGETVLRESSIIIEYLALRYPGPVALLPADRLDALHTRFLDRFFDQYIMTPMQHIVFDFRRPPQSRDPLGVEQAKQHLEGAYQWLETNALQAPWLAGPDFSLADCAAAPSLFYADWVHPMEQRYPKLKAFRQRLLQHPSVTRAVEEARPYRGFFPPGAPDRD